MRRIAVSVLVLMCSLLGYGQVQPQWKVVQQAILTNQTTPIAPTTIFTPSSTGWYRLSAYISVKSSVPLVGGNGWRLHFSWYDITGEPLGSALEAEFQSGVFNVVQLPATMFSAQANVPVSYSVNKLVNPANTTYNIAFTIEQLTE